MGNMNMITVRLSDAELSAIYRRNFERHFARFMDSGLALEAAGELLRKHLEPGQTGAVDQEFLTWASD
jgi:hypothetical protein